MSRKAPNWDNRIGRIITRKMAEYSAKNSENTKKMANIESEIISKETAEETLKKAEEFVQEIRTAVQEIITREEEPENG